MLRRLWRKIRPFSLWIVLATPAELLGVLFVAAALFEGERGMNTDVASAGFFLIAAPLPWLVARIWFARLWRDIRRFPLAMAIAVVAWLFGGLLFTMAFDEAMAAVGLCVIGAPLLWIAARVWSLRRLRRSMVRELMSALPHGSPPGADALSEIPFVIAGRRIYYPLDKKLESQEIDQLAWAYGEVFAGWFMCQLALWNRDAHAAVLPIYAPDVPEALRRLRAAAPWVAIGFNRALVDSWNFDHQEFLDLIDRHRESARPFEPAWSAGAGLAFVSPRFRRQSRIDGGASERLEKREVQKALALWGKRTAI